MKNTLLLILMCFCGSIAAQVQFPVFLEGTWKKEGQEIYEHWDLLNEHSLIGISYRLRDDQINITEYLRISREKDQIIYTATVLNQNQGNGVPFLLTRSDSVWIFSNPNHDFPREIEYRKQGDNTLLVQISDGHEKRFTYALHKQNVPILSADSTISNPNYDAALASQLGADDYGMKGFVLILLKTGPNQSDDKEFISQSFRGHLDNINRLVEEGKLIVAGPMGRNDKAYRGIFILDVSSLEEAESLLQTDPAIKAGLLEAELYNWYGSAALSTYLEDSDKVWKKQP